MGRQHGRRRQGVPNGDAPACPGRKRVSAAETIPLRGRIYEADLGHGLKPYLVVSNNARNQKIEDVIVARITTTRRDLPSWVPLGPADPIAGFVVCDDLELMFREEIKRDLGALSLAAMLGVGKGLAHALAL